VAGPFLGQSYEIDGTAPKASGTAIQGMIEFVLRLLGFHHLVFVPFAFTKSLNTNQINAFASLFFYKADTLVLDVFYSVACVKFWITHTFIL
jgi:hypothetical protein